MSTATDAHPIEPRTNLGSLTMSPPTDVFLEWNTAVSKRGCCADEPRRDDWRWLYHRCFRKGKWRVPAEEARLVAEMGMSAAMIEGRYYDAAEIGRRLFLHPQIHELSREDRNEASFWYGSALLCTGKQKVGVEIFREMLAMEEWGALPRRVLVTEALIAYCERMESTTPISNPVRALTHELLYDWPGFRRRSFDLEDLETVGEMGALLEEVRSH